MIKKYALSLIIIFALSAEPAFAGLTDDLVEQSYNDFDLPLVDGMAYFADTATGFAKIARTLGNLLGVVCIVWNAFKLWMGTETVKKACVDIITKFMIFVIVLNIYPKIMEGTLNLAVDVGAKVGRGYNSVGEEYYTLYQSCKKRLEAAQAATRSLVMRELGEGSAISEDAAKALAGSVEIDENAFVAFLGQTGTEVVSESDGLLKRARLSAKTKEADKKVVNVLMQQFKEQDLSQAITTLKSMEEVFDITRTGGGGDLSAITGYFYHPFIKNKNGDYTNIISPGSMIKSAVVIAQILSTKESMYYQENKENPKESVGFMKRVVENTIQSLLHTLLVILMSFGVIAATVFFVAQYCMCIFEYSIVSAAGIIFIPFCLWDGTKSFAAKLVTLFTSYFIKIMVMVLTIFWVFSAFLRMGNSIIADPAGINFLNFSYFVFTLLLGFVVTQNGPAIAVSLLNGSPQLSMGEFMQAAGTAAGAAMAAGKAGAAVGKAAGGAAQGAGRAVGTGIAAGKKAATEASVLGNAIKETIKAEGGDEKKADKAASAGATGQFVKSLARTAGHGILNSAAKLATGQQTESSKEGIKVGEKDKDGREINTGAAWRNAQAGGEAKGQEAADNWKANRGKLGVSGDKGKENAEEHAQTTPPATDGGGAE